MSYRTALDLASALSDTDKLKLAHHLLGQLMLSPKSSSAPTPKLPPSADYDYCLERVLKSRPNRLPALQTFLEAIFSFRGGQDANIDDIIKRLELNKIIKKEGENVPKITKSTRKIFVRMYTTQLVKYRFALLTFSNNADDCH